MKVKELLKTKRNWTKNAFARTANGIDTCSSDLKAVSYCLSGAISRCYKPIDEWKIKHLVLRRLGCKYISDWNDNRKRTFAHVKKLINELDI